ncbi:MAG TPA: gluconate kinase [Anaerolineae bacterium]|nr:gluconate kinase [Anaerolineae bacterium]
MGFLVMGVSGSGKTSLGVALAYKLGWEFLDADDFHPPENIGKMADGIPLDDSDRAPWLASLHDQLLTSLKADRHPVLACSALKESYRAQLLDKIDGIAVIYLKGSYDLILSRISAREGHYMKSDMLKSQFDILEEPQSAFEVDVSKSLDEMVESILQTYAV